MVIILDRVVGYFCEVGLLVILLMGVILSCLDLLDLTLLLGHIIVVEFLVISREFTVV